MKGYNSYKESGIEWIGKVPEDWDVIKLKWLTPIKRGASPRPIDDLKYFDENGEFSWVRIADVSASERYLENTKEKLSELGASLSVKQYPGDFFLSIAGSVGKPIITKIKCCIHDGFVWFPELKINPEYLYYIFQTGLPFIGLGKIGTQLNLNTETIGNIVIPNLSDDDIKKIVSFLDYKTSVIDATIERKKRLIELLKEKRQAVINEAVTKGLNPNAPMKDSGIEWLESIPEHWVVSRFNRGIELLTDYEANGSFDSIKKNVEFTDDEGYAWYVRATDLENNNIKDVDKVRWVDELTYDFLSKTKLIGKELLIAKRGEIGKVYLMPKTNYKATLAPNLYLVRLNEKLNPNFTWYYFESYVGKNQLILKNRSVTIGAIYKDDLKEIDIVYPPINEQFEIIEYLNEECNKITNIQSIILQQTENLKAYRQSLISEVVTGKIDVRDWEKTKN